MYHQKIPLLYFYPLTYQFWVVAGNFPITWKGFLNSSYLRTNCLFIVLRSRIQRRVSYFLPTRPHTLGCVILSFCIQGFSESLVETWSLRLDGWLCHLASVGFGIVNFLLFSLTISYFIGDSIGRDESMNFYNQCLSARSRFSMSCYWFCFQILPSPTLLIRPFFIGYFVIFLYLCKNKFFF